MLFEFFSIMTVKLPIYGDEFDLSCTKDEFDENFILIDKKK